MAIYERLSDDGLCAAAAVLVVRVCDQQHWHERYRHDPANRWLRSVVAERFLE